MEKWNKPQLTDLSIKFTEAGNLGRVIDGVFITIPGHGTFMKTSGPVYVLPRP